MTMDSRLHKFLIFLLYIVLQSFSGIVTVQASEQCVWYGVCHKGVTEKQYCPYNGPPKQISSQGKKFLLERCGHLLDNNSDANLCCDEEQISILNSNIKLAANFLERCPSCMANLVRHMCDFTCSKNQSSFMQIVSTEKTDKEYITEINIHITEKYLNDTFKSCSQVFVPSTGQLALDMMCGSYGASRCTPLKWFHFMGDAKSNPFVPFQINYVPYKDVSPVNQYEPLDSKTFPCNQALNDKTSACSCVDCEASCPNPPPDPPTPEPFNFGGFDAYSVIMLTVFLVGTALFLMGVCLFPAKTMEVGLMSDEDDSSRLNSNIGRRLAGGHSSSDVTADREDSPLQSKRSSMLNGSSISSFAYDCLVYVTI